MNHHLINGMLAFIHGTAWAEEQTATRGPMALEAGLRGIDSESQRRHTQEAAVGEALARAFDDGLVSRKDRFLHTTLTHAAGRDHRLSYDGGASPAGRVGRSPLNGTSSPQHVRDDSKVCAFELTEDEVATIESLFA